MDRTCDPDTDERVTGVKVDSPSSAGSSVGKNRTEHMNESHTFTVSIDSEGLNGNERIFYLAYTDAQLNN